MTTRDRAILGVLAVFGLLAAFWFLGLSPKRDELKKLDETVEVSEQALAAARQEADQFAKDRLAFPQAYTAMVRLGKAVPANADVPSLVVQLEGAAADAHVNFRSVKLEAGKGGSAPAPAPAPSAPAAAGSGTTGPAGAAGASTGATGAAGATGASSSTASTPSGASASAAGAAATAGAAPANATTAATLPIGADVGSAQLPVMRFNLIFQGNFFKMAGLIHNVRQLVKRQDRKLLVSGRLLTLDGFAFEEGDFGFPQVKATMTTTAYLLPVSQGLLNGTTAQGPAGATAATPAPVSTGATTPPTAVVTGP